MESRTRALITPTVEFTLLPLDAAGPYKKKSHDLSHFYISSYTPTLSALIRARPRVSRDILLPLSKPTRTEGNDSDVSLPSQVLSLIVSRPSHPLHRSRTAMKQSRGASDALDRNQWLHLACHGMPNRQQPFESSFAMRDGPLMIKDIIRSRWQDPEFAFLSACHT